MSALAIAALLGAAELAAFATSSCELRQVRVVASRQVDDEGKPQDFAIGMPGTRLLEARGDRGSAAVVDVVAPSGDWSRRTAYCFTVRGRVRLRRSEASTTYGGVAILEVVRYLPRLARTAIVTDLASGAVVKPGGGRFMPPPPPPDAHTMRELERAIEQNGR